MSLEKPISTIRKAIEGTAQKSASAEFLDKPEKRHYNDAFDFYKYMRGFEPEKVEQVIMVAAKSKELSDEMGAELLKVFNKVWEDVTLGSEEKLNKAIERLKETILSHIELNQEIIKLEERFLKLKTNELKNDPRIVSAFAGKEELLNKGVQLAISSTLEMSTTFENSPQLKSATWKEVMEKIARMKRGKPTLRELKEIKEFEEKMSKKNRLPNALFDKLMKFFRSIS